MSTKYAFYCRKNNMLGGFFSKAAWGWGDFDFVQAFKFLSYCISKHGHRSIDIISEKDREWRDAIHIFNPKNKDEELLFNKFIDDTKDVFPYSKDWTYKNDMEQ